MTSKDGVFGGGADEGDGAVFDVGEDGVLLGFVEAVDLVDEEDGALGTPGAGLGHDAAEVGDAGGDGGELLEAGVGAAGDDAGEGGLAGAGRAPEDDRGQLAGLDEAAEELAGADEVLLADVVVEVRGRMRAARGCAGGRGPSDGEGGSYARLRVARRFGEPPMGDAGTTPDYRYSGGRRATAGSDEPTGEAIASSE